MSVKIHIKFHPAKQEDDIKKSDKWNAEVELRNLTDNKNVPTILSNKRASFCENFALNRQAKVKPILKKSPSYDDIFLSSFQKEQGSALTENSDFIEELRRFGNFPK